YGDVEAILKAAPQIKAKRAREALLSSAAEVRLSKQLVTIMTELPIELDLEALSICEPDRRALREVFLDLEFHTLVREIAAPEAETRTLERAYSVVTSPALVEAIATRATN